MIEKAVILKHKTEPYTGMVLGGIFYRVGSRITPQLFPYDVDKEWIKRSITGTESMAYPIEDFDIIPVKLTYG